MRPPPLETPKEKRLRLKRERRRASERKWIMLYERQQGKSLGEWGYRLPGNRTTIHLPENLEGKCA